MSNILYTQIRQNSFACSEGHSNYFVVAFTYEVIKTKCNSHIDFTSFNSVTTHIWYVANGR